MDKYIIHECIGHGTYSSVYKAAEKNHGTNHEPVLNSYVAIKVLHSKSFDYEDYTKEVSILRLLNHPNIIKYIDSFKIDNSENNFCAGNFQQQKPQSNDKFLAQNKSMDGSFCIVSEFVEGIDLLHYLNENGPFREPECKKVMVQLLSAISYLHSKNIMHRDLKLENVMITNDLKVKIIDFGFSCQSGNGDSLRTTICGSVAYCAPEILLNIPYTYGCDIWSLGIIFYSVVVQQLPFWDENVNILAKKILEMQPTYPLFVSRDCQNFINLMLEHDQNSRPTISSIVQNPYISLDYSIYQNLIQYPNSEDKEDDEFGPQEPLWMPRFMNQSNANSPGKGYNFKMMKISPSDFAEDPNDLTPQKRTRIKPKGSLINTANMIKRFSMINIFTQPTNSNNQSVSTQNFTSFSTARKRRRTFAHVQILQNNISSNKSNLSEAHVNSVTHLQPLYQKNSYLSQNSSTSNIEPNSPF